MTCSCPTPRGIPERRHFGSCEKCAIESTPIAGGCGSVRRWSEHLTDDELLDVWERTVAGVREGTIPIFDDKEAFLADAKKRFGLKPRAT